MPSIRLKAKNKESLDKIEEIINNTKIIKKQIELNFNRWDFVVFGPGALKGSTVIREGYAEQLRIYDNPVYSLSVGNSDRLEVKGIPIEEFADGDIPVELEGLNVFQSDPLRPLKVESIRKGQGIERTADLIEKEYQDKNIAVIQTPKEDFWAISVLYYLNECDRYFPDFFTDSIRLGKLPLKVNFLNYSSVSRFVS